MGDAAGIGPEIIAKACAQGLGAPAVVYGDPAIMRRATELLGARLRVLELAAIDQASGQPGCIEVIARGTRCRPTCPPDASARRPARAPTTTCAPRSTMRERDAYAPSSPRR